MFISAEMQRCRSCAEVVQVWCSRAGSEVVQRCRGVEVQQRCRSDAEQQNQNICRIAQVQVQTDAASKRSEVGAHMDVLRRC